MDTPVDSRGEVNLAARSRRNVILALALAAFALALFAGFFVAQSLRG